MKWLAVPLPVAQNHSIIILRKFKFTRNRIFVVELARGPRQYQGHSQLRTLEYRIEGGDSFNFLDFFHGGAQLLSNPFYIVLIGGQLRNI